MASVAEAIQAAGLSRNTHFVFEHKVFTVAGACFAAPDDVEHPMFYMQMGDATVSVPLKSLCREFGIEEGAPDFELLETVARSLKYVKQIRPNDSIPNEILDGTASWSVEDHHRIAASGRITYQLVSWMIGEEEVVTDLARLHSLVENPEIQAQLPDAAAFAAEKLGLGPEAKQDVLDRTEHLANELTYIEALREYLDDIKEIQSKVSEFLSTFKSEATIKEDLVRVQDLLRNPVAEFDAKITEIDVQTCEIITVLKRYEDQVEMIRKIRDELHFALMDWEEMRSRWAATEVAQDDEAIRLIRDTYRFLAQNFAQTKRW